MTRLLSVLLVLNLWTFSENDPKSPIKLGKYGVYGSWDLYTELQLLDSNKFVFNHVAPNAPPMRHITGTWMFKDGHLKLSGKFDKRWVADEYELKGDSVLCPAKEINHIPCLSYKP